MLGSMNNQFLLILLDKNFVFLQIILETYNNITNEINSKKLGNIIFNHLS